MSTATLREMLTYCRPAGSTAEREFIDRFIVPLPGAYRSIGNNWIVTIGTSPVLFSCHTDTVHRTSGRQTIHVSSLDVASLSQRAARSGSNCLGADDTAGVWLCCELIAAGVPGTYVFHYGEERGGIGSSALARSPEGDAWLKQFTYAIAFDRRGTGDVITHQGGRTASDTFATSLAAALGAAGLPGYTPTHGIYTDTAEYTDAIGECTNLSVGYRHEHTRDETLSLRHCAALRDAIARLDVESLVASRTPGMADPDDDLDRYDSLYADSDQGWWKYLDYRDKAATEAYVNATSYRLDPEYDRIQEQLTLDLLRYRGAK